MPSFNFIKECKVEPSFRNKSVIDTFDLNVKDKLNEHFKGNIDIDEKDYNVGLIGVGRTILNTLGEMYYKENKALSILSSSPSLFNSLKNDKHFRLTHKGRSSIHKKESMRKTTSFNRVTFSFKYMS